MSATISLELLSRYGWTLAGPALLAGLVWLLNKNEDMREHRRGLLFCLGMLGAAPLIGWLVWALGNSAIAGLLTSLLFGALSVHLLLRVVDRATNDFLGGLLYDLIFAEGSFAEIVRPPKKLPNVTLLDHWRKIGLARKAYRAARRGLVKERNAFPVWLFAAETAALHLQSLPKAVSIIRRLCRCADFSDDQKTFAVNTLKGWAATKGCDLDTRSLLASFGQRPRAKPLREIIELRRRGHYEQARIRLMRIRQTDPENLAAAALLVSLYAQDLRLPRSAEQVITELERQPFTPTALTDYLRNSLKGWAPPSPGTAKVSGSSASDEAGIKRRMPADRILLPGAPVVRPMLPLSEPDLGSEPEKPESKPKPAFTENLSPQVAQLVSENRLGTAVELLEQLLAQRPNDLHLLLELAQVRIVNCGNLKAGERIVAKIERDSRFTATQKHLAETKLSEWRRMYHEQQPVWAY